MGRNKWLAGLALMAGLAVPGASTLTAGERYWDGRDMRGDYRQAERLRADIARDQYRLDEDIRCGRRRAVKNDERDLRRDERALGAVSRDIRHDRERERRDYRDRW